MFNWVNLDERTRAFMLEELEMDAAGKDGVYLSSWLSEQGRRDYPGLLREAVESHDDAWLAAELNKNRRLKEKATRRLAPLKSTTYDLPPHAADQVAGDAFNRLYGRGVCRRAIADGIENVIVYRARESRKHRIESDRLEGSAVNARQLLEAIRSHPDEDTGMGLFAPRSGMSVRLP